MSQPVVHFEGVYGKRGLVTCKVNHMWLHWQRLLCWQVGPPLQRHGELENGPRSRGCLGGRVTGDDAGEWQHHWMQGLLLAMTSAGDVLQHLSLFALGLPTGGLSCGSKQTVCPVGSSSTMMVGVF